VELDAFISITDDANELLRVVVTESCGQWMSCHFLEKRKRKSETQRDEEEEERVEREFFFIQY
jgi:hypothetical protein